MHDLPWNLALIRRLRAKKHREKQQNNHVTGRAGDGPPEDDGAAGKVGKRSKITFTESGDHQPCVMPACGHTFTRITASRLLEKARASQQAERNDQNMLPSAVACVLSLLCIAAWPDGRVAGFLRVVLLCSCFYVRWRVKIRLIFDTVDPAVPTTLQCPACGTKQPEVSAAPALVHVSAQAFAAHMPAHSCVHYLSLWCGNDASTALDTWVKLATFRNLHRLEASFSPTWARSRVFRCCPAVSAVILAYRSLTSGKRVRDRATPTEIPLGQSVVLVG